MLVADMKFFKNNFSSRQIIALLRKDGIVRYRQPFMPIVQILWPCAVFALLFLVRLKFGPEEIDECQFPSRLLPTKHNVLSGFHSYICALENKCSSPRHYEEQTGWENAPIKPVVNIVQLLINDDKLFNSLVELPEKPNFLRLVTNLFTGGHLDEIKTNVEKVINRLPMVQKMLNGSFDIKKMFSDRDTFVKSGYLMCDGRFPSSESIPLVNDILLSEDFSEVNNDELNVMPTEYCKRLYLNITSTNYGKLTWYTIKPIVHGKILFTPNDAITQSIVQFANATFDEVNRLKMLSVAMYEVLTKLRQDEVFQKSFDSVLNLTKSPIVQNIVGDTVDLDEIKSTILRIRTDPTIYDILQTVKNLLECFSVDRFIGIDEPDQLHREAFELNKKRLFFAAIHFDNVNTSDVAYHLHMDTENTRSTFRTRNRFWFPGPSGNMLEDMQYHRGFVQIKQALDLGIIKHKKQIKLDATKNETGPSKASPSSFFKIRIANDDNETDDDGDEDDDWLSNYDIANEKAASVSKSNTAGLLSTPFEGFSYNGLNGSNEQVNEKSLKTSQTLINSTKNSFSSDEILGNKDDLASGAEAHVRSKRQGLLDIILGSNTPDEYNFLVDGVRFFTKQFPYPAYVHDNFKTGVYLAQAVQTAFFLGLLAQIASCVRHRIWMRESRNTLIMRSMGLKSHAEVTTWTLVTFGELLLIFIAITLILYSGGILKYNPWWFIMIFLICFGCCLISFCYMCSNFFASANVGAVSTAIFFFISFCPYILVLLFDTSLSSLQSFCVNLSFTTAFSHAWNHIMRVELQQTGLTLTDILQGGLQTEFNFGLAMIILDTILYLFVGYFSQRYMKDEFRFIEVTRENLDPSLGSTMTNVSKIFDGNKFAVSNISLSFAKDQITCLLGRNGAGKSTIIKMLTGQIVQTSGRVILSQSRSGSEDKVGVCWQDNILIPELTAREHLELYAKIKLRRDYMPEVEKTLKKLNFGKYESYQATQLSGGYQRRLCVAIAFVGSPNVVILDEPCNGVDTMARKDIWELIERLRKSRAVILATHFLDEAEYLSDSIIIMKNGKIVAKHTPETLKELCGKSFQISLRCEDVRSCDEVTQKASQYLNSYKVLESTGPTDMQLEIAYEQRNDNIADFIAHLEELHRNGRLSELCVESKNLEQLFNQLDCEDPNKVGKGNIADILQTVELKKQSEMESVREQSLTRCEAMRELFRKRLVHFRRDSCLLVCILVLPALFEILAMWFVSYRPEDDFDKVISFKRALYPKTMQFFSLENPTNATEGVYGSLVEECNITDMLCRDFPNSRPAFYWLLNTLGEYRGKRYGGYSFNDSNAVVWYNNKGYHAMMAWLNDLNTHIFQAELNDTEYSITSYNEPWKLGDRELSTTSILRQVGDSVLVIILVIAYSLVIAAASVYIVNERVKGEKLQQKLCGVDSTTYWIVAFIWDFLIIMLTLLIFIAVILAFSIPVFVDRQQLWGIIVISLCFAFACIPAIYVIEKAFNDSSVAIMMIFCMNVIIPLFTMSVILLLGVVGDSATWDDWRYFLNRVFLIFPQHAFSDGLLEICKNYMVAQIFHRYDIDSYKNPLNSNLLLPHFTALILLGVFFAVLNILIESGLLHRWQELLTIRQADRQHMEELKIVSIQNSLKRNDKYDAPKALKVENLCKFYKRGQYVVKNVSFSVTSGECFGLLGKNGAGKSTIFKMLAGEMQPTAGSINYFEHEISYCPQTNTLDSLLTVSECIEFYGRLRRIVDIPKLVSSTLESYQLESYRDVLVSNLSGGNRRKLSVATNCLGRTSVVLMDEPTSDMDPITRAMIYRTIANLIAEQRAIVLTSHSISEIDEICQRVGVLKEGQMVTCSSPQTLKARYAGYYEVVFSCDHAESTTVEKEIRERFPTHRDLQIYARAIKFGVETKSLKDVTRTNENGVDITAYEGDSKSDDSVMFLSELFRRLHALSRERGLRYTINCCRLDTVFERILDSKEGNWPVTTAGQLNGHVSAADLGGSPATGYVHKGFVETETVA